MRRTLIYIALALIFLWGSASLYFSLKPRIAAYTRTQIGALSSKYTPFTFEVEDIGLSLFSPAIQLRGIKVQSKEKQWAEALQDFSVEEVRVQLNIFRLLAGEVYLSALVIEGVDGRLVEPQQLNLDDLMGGRQEKEDGAFNWPALFAQIRALPIKSLVITDIDLEIESQGRIVSLADLDVILDKYFDEIQLKSFGPQINFTNSATKESIRFSEEIYASFDKKQFRLHNFHLRLQDSYLKASAHGEGLHKGLDHLDSKVSLESRFDARLLTDLMKIFLSKPDPLLANGLLDLSGEVRIAPGQKISGEGQVTSENLKLEQYDLGDIKAKGSYTGDILTFTSLDLEHSAGRAQIKDFSVQVNPQVRMKGTADVTQLDLQKLFLALGLEGIPVDLMIQGQLPCEGQLQPLLIQCTPDLRASGLQVKASKDAESSIVAIESFSAQGSVQVDAEKVTYKAQVKMPQSRGGSEGSVIYAKGFDISYFGDEVAFSDVKELANLSFEGKAVVRGRTWGDSSYGRIDMMVETSNFWFENFGIGQAKTQLTYQSGVLALKELTGHLGVSRYRGNLEIDLLQNQLKTDFNFPYVETSDVLQSLSRKTTLPFEITGSGTAAFTAQGPLNLSELSYELNTKIFKGHIANESFDRFHADVHSIQGDVKTRKVFLQKGQAQVSLDATVNPLGEVEAVLVASDLMLDEFNTVARLSAPVSGELDFRAGIKGPITKPEISLKGSLEAFSVAGKELASSHFNLNIHTEAARGSANLIGNRVKSEFQIPFKDGIPLLIKLDTKDWDFSTLLSLLGGEGLHKEYQSSLTSKIYLTSESGKLWESTGAAEITDFRLSRQHYGVSNDGPIEITVNEGKFFISNFKLIGPESLLEVAGRNFSRDKLSVSVNGHTDLRLLHIFAPFLEEVSGPASLSVRIGGRLEEPEMLGSAFLDRVFVKLPGFPHPLERVRSDILFSQRRVLINTLKGQMAGGAFSGDGTIVLEGVKKLPMNIKLLVEGATLHIPKGVKSTGVANLRLTGDWFPFVIKGEYKVDSALIDMEFAGSTEATKGPKRSIYLPEDVTSNSFEPIAFNIKVLLDKNVQIKNALIQGQLRGELLLTGTPNNPGITGQIRALDGTQVLFKEQVFKVSSATVQFDNPEQLNPEIFLTASSRVQEWDINLLVQGHASDPQIRLTSQPPLSEEDLISLLAIGIVSSSQAANELDPEQQQRNSQYQIGSAVFNQSSLNKDLQERLGVEIVLSSALEDTRVVPTATLSRKITKDITASYTRNLGRGGEDTAKLRYQMNDNVAAIGSWQGGESGQDRDATKNAQTESIFGLDLEYRVEFK